MNVATKNFTAGDIVTYGGGKLDYLVQQPGDDGLYVNACSKSWIEQGLRTFCEELYPFSHDDREAATVVGHYGNGTVTDAVEWYNDNKDRCY